MREIKYVHDNQEAVASATKTYIEEKLGKCFEVDVTTDNARMLVGKTEIGCSEYSYIKVKVNRIGLEAEALCVLPDNAVLPINQPIGEATFSLRVDDIDNGTSGELIQFILYCKRVSPEVRVNERRILDRVVMHDKVSGEYIVSEPIETEEATSGEITHPFEDARWSSELARAKNFDIRGNIHQAKYMEYVFKLINSHEEHRQPELVSVYYIHTIECIYRFENDEWHNVNEKRHLWHSELVEDVNKSTSTNIASLTRQKNECS
ncbi:MAG: hypothetical protein LBC74_01015 [Planctomycetaceae bacterium]|jgi:hypothetical protein|nr:hypothetical protein [Planctomycetaceae bacterium]